MSRGRDLRPTPRIRVGWRCTLRLVLTVLLVLPTALARPAGQACCRQDIRAGEPFTVSGTVLDSVRGQGLLIRDADGLLHTIRCVGPNRFWREQERERPGFGDRITVEGYVVQCAERGESVASRIRFGDEAVELRDPETGRPLWVD